MAKTDVVKQIRKATCRKFSADEKIRIVLEGLRGETPISEICRREGIAASVYYKWSKSFLEAGKTVIFRPFGYPPNVWGVVDLEPLYAHDKFLVVSTVPNDLHYYKRANEAITMLNEELVINHSEPNSGNGVFTIFPGVQIDIFNQINDKLKSVGIDWNTHQYCITPWKTLEEIDKMYSDCLMFLDLNGTFRYPFLEAIMHGKAVVDRGLGGKSPQCLYMNETGLTNNDFWYNDYVSAADMVTKVYNDEDLRLKIHQAQSLWLNTRLEQAMEVWKHVLEVK